MGNITKLSQGNLDGIKKQVCECIDHAQAEGYKRGYTKGKNDGHAQGCHTQMEHDKAKIDEAKQDGYNDGYNTAINDYNMMIQWLHESRKDFISFLSDVYLYNLEGDMTTGSILYDIILKWNMRELIYEFKQCQEQKKQTEEEIKVGDEVITFGSKAIVTRVEDKNIRLFYSDGSGGRFDNNVESIEKTGRNFSAEVSQLLDKLKGDK